MVRKNKLMYRLVFFAFLFCAISSFAKGEKDGNKVQLKPVSRINKTTSYHTYEKNGLYSMLPFGPTTPYAMEKTPCYLARTYADFDKDGDLDIMTVRIDWKVTGTGVEYFRNNKGIFTKDQTVFLDSVPEAIHARKMISGDFDGNGWMDVVISGHGYDVAPFRGEDAKIIFNTKGRFTYKKLPLQDGFYHSVCSGDVDNDGDLDLFFTDALNGKHKICKFLLNDGNGNFVYDKTLFPVSLQGKAYFTSELFDINSDGYLDLAISGHEMDGAETLILWGNKSGKYMMEQSTALPLAKDFGVAIDIDFIDFNRDKIMDIVISRTGDYKGPVGFYQGHMVQLIRNENNTQFTDVSASHLKDNMVKKGQWLSWLRVHDINKDGWPDITSDDHSDNMEWINQKGSFLKVSH